MVLLKLHIFVPPNSYYNIILNKLKMKTRQNLIKGILVMGLSLSALIAKPNNSSLKRDNGIESAETEKMIRESLKFPSAETKNEKVEILFTTGQTGNVNFVLVKTANATLQKEIEKQFYNMHLSKLKEGVVHSVILNFKKI